MPTFGEIAQLVIADAQNKSTNAKVRYQWERHLGEVYSGPLARQHHSLRRPRNGLSCGFPVARKKKRAAFSRVRREPLFRAFNEGETAPRCRGFRPCLE